VLNAGSSGVAIPGSTTYPNGVYPTGSVTSTLTAVADVATSGEFPGIPEYPGPDVYPGKGTQVTSTTITPRVLTEVPA